MSIIQTTSNAFLSKMNFFYDKVFRDKNKKIKPSLMQKFTRSCLAKMNRLYYLTYISKNEFSPFQRHIQSLLYTAAKEDVESVELRYNQSTDKTEIFQLSFDGQRSSLNLIPGCFFKPMIEEYHSLISLQIDNNNVLTESILKLEDKDGNVATWKMSSPDLTLSFIIKADKRNQDFNHYNCLYTPDQKASRVACSLV